MASGSSRPTCDPALRSASWQVRASASGSVSWPSGEEERDGEGRARGQARPDRDGAGDPDGAAARRRLQAEEPGRQEGLGAAPGRCSPSAISTGSSGNWSESIPTRKLPGFGVKVTSVASSMAMGSERPPL